MGDSTNTNPQGNATGSNASAPQNGTALTDNGGVQGAQGGLTDNGGLNAKAYGQTRSMPSASVSTGVQIDPNWTPDPSHLPFGNPRDGTGKLGGNYLQNGGMPDNPNPPRPGRIGSGGGRILDINGNVVNNQPTDVMGGRVFRSSDDRTPQPTWDSIFRSGANGDNAGYQGMPGSAQPQAQFSPAYRQAFDTHTQKWAMENGYSYTKDQNGNATLAPLPALPSSPTPPGGNYGLVRSASTGFTQDAQGNAVSYTPLGGRPVALPPAKVITAPPSLAARQAAEGMTPNQATMNQLTASWGGSGSGGGSGTGAVASATASGAAPTKPADPSFTGTYTRTDWVKDPSGFTDLAGNQNWMGTTNEYHLEDGNEVAGAAREPYTVGTQLPWYRFGRTPLMPAPKGSARPGIQHISLPQLPHSKIARNP